MWTTHTHTHTFAPTHEHRQARSHDGSGGYGSRGGWKASLPPTPRLGFLAVSLLGEEPGPLGGVAEAEDAQEEAARFPPGSQDGFKGC